MWNCGGGGNSDVYRIALTLPPAAAAGAGKPSCSPTVLPKYQYFSLQSEIKQNEKVRLHFLFEDTQGLSFIFLKSFYYYYNFVVVVPFVRSLFFFFQMILDGSRNNTYNFFVTQLYSFSFANVKTARKNCVRGGRGWWLEGPGRSGHSSHTTMQNPDRVRSPFSFRGWVWFGFALFFGVFFSFIFLFFTSLCICREFIGKYVLY